MFLDVSAIDRPSDCNTTEDERGDSLLQEQAPLEPESKIRDQLIHFLFQDHEVGVFRKLSDQTEQIETKNTQIGPTVCSAQKVQTRSSGEMQSSLQQTNAEVVRLKERADQQDHLIAVLTGKMCQHHLNVMSPETESAATSQVAELQVKVIQLEKTIEEMTKATDESKRQQDEALETSRKVSGIAKAKRRLSKDESGAAGQAAVPASH